MAWLDPQPIASDLHKLYRNYWTHGGAGRLPPPPNAESSPSGKRRARAVLASLMPWRRHALLADNRYLSTMKPGRLLDVGCGMGDFAAGMATLGWDAHGIDFDEGAIAVADRQPGLKATTGGLLEQRYKSESFDAITMSNVIEHLPNPRETLAECFRILRPGGRAVVITPNFQSYGHKLFGRDWRGLEPPRHLNLFTRHSLKRLAEDTGFSGKRTFTASGAIRPMFDASNEIALKLGRPLLGQLSVRVRIAEVLVLLGIPFGEWVVLLAEKHVAARPIG